MVVSYFLLFGIFQMFYREYVFCNQKKNFFIKIFSIVIVPLSFWKSEIMKNREEQYLSNHTNNQEEKIYILVRLSGVVFLARL